MNDRIIRLTSTLWNFLFFILFVFSIENKDFLDEKCSPVINNDQKNEFSDFHYLFSCKDKDFSLCILESDIVIPWMYCQSNLEIPFSASVLNRNWDCPIPYVIESDVDPSIVDNIFKAILHWEYFTEWQFVQRTDETDYVLFYQSTGCFAVVGHYINLGAHVVGLSTQCTVRSVIHEIGHIVGLLHEQTRYDQDDFVEILTKNIPERYINNFETVSNQEIGGFYDFFSVMHYTLNSFICTIDCPSGPRDSPRELTIKIHPEKIPFCCQDILDQKKCCVGRLYGLSIEDIRKANERINLQCPVRKNFSSHFEVNTIHITATILLFTFIHL